LIDGPVGTKMGTFFFIIICCLLLLFAPYFSLFLLDYQLMNIICVYGESRGGRKVWRVVGSSPFFIIVHCHMYSHTHPLPTESVHPSVASSIVFFTSIPNHIFEWHCLWWRKHTVRILGLCSSDDGGGRLVSCRLSLFCLLPVHR